ncbi:HU family DNA-binding protein [Deinococcus soli (ex Cha et al. 2016)]|uniref:HU family DNA-binding protein n=1 Tax=Deinococcus soli (ex Cha et al. 2016) TaxID=1309411 RepID=UPI0019B8BA3B|nr:HU family DNA-binding protein [Deinococcus soli (ex Cha et al. 2016)]GGB70762.1 hypothetical protein GCM10008019_28670 [Deinococcus soli (ex Cha et al. 2016)]
MNKLNKAALVAQIVTRTGLTTRQATSAVNAMLDSMTSTLTAGTPIGLPGLGTFKVLPTVERTGVRPSTGETIVIPAGRKVTFKVADDLKRTLGPQRES